MIHLHHLARDPKVSYSVSKRIPYILSFMEGSLYPHRREDLGVSPDCENSLQREGFGDIGEDGEE